MAQLRDAKTSEILYEGTPLECVLLADKLGRDEVIFDDVGLGFDPDAVLSGYQEDRDALKKITASRAKDGAEHRQNAKDDLAARDAEVAAVDDVHSEVDKRLQEARARLED